MAQKSSSAGRYVDGFVIPILKRNLNTYRRMAKKGAEVWKKYGALDYKECIGDDLKNQWGSTFSKLAKIKPGETVVFSYIVYKSKAHRDRVNAKVMKDPELMADMQNTKMPFDMKRMAYGGFKIIVQA